MNEELKCAFDSMDHETKKALLEGFKFTFGLIVQAKKDSTGMSTGQLEKILSKLDKDYLVAINSELAGLNYYAKKTKKEYDACLNEKLKGPPTIQLHDPLVAISLFDSLVSGPQEKSYFPLLEAFYHSREDYIDASRKLMKRSEKHIALFLFIMSSVIAEKVLPKNVKPLKNA